MDIVWNHISVRSNNYTILQSVLCFFQTGALATVGALTYGLFSFIRGDTKMQQYMMRARVAAQGGTIVAVATGVAFMLFRDSQNKKS